MFAILAPGSSTLIICRIRQRILLRMRPPRPPRRALPPGSRGLKLLRNSFTMANDWSGFLSRCAREYGDVIYFRFLNVPICLVVHPDGIEKILVKDQANFLKARDYRALRPILGNGLLTSEGEFWQAQRKLIQLSFRH